MQFSHHYQIFTTGMQKRRKRGKTEASVTRTPRAVCCSNSLLLQQSHAGSRYNKGNIISAYLSSGSILAARDAASLGIIWYLSFGELKQETRVRFF